MSRGRRKVWEAEGAEARVWVCLSPQVFYRPVRSPGSQNTVSWGLFTLSVCLFFLPPRRIDSFLPERSEHPCLSKSNTGKLCLYVCVSWTDYKLLKRRNHVLINICSRIT